MNMAHIIKEASVKLYEIAESQQGYFTTKQAKKAGYAENTHPYHVRAVNWIREHRGIYRLKLFPVSNEGQYVLYSLWSQNRDAEVQGIYSHETALVLHNLSDLMPSKLHISVPKSFRRNSKIPKVLVLHFQNIPSDDIEQKHGFLVTKPFRALLDVIRENSVSPEFQKQALMQAIELGLVSRAEIKKTKLSLEDRVAIEHLLKEVA